MSSRTRAAVAAPLGLLTLLAACGPGRNEFPPACPSATLVRPTADLIRYRAGSTGRDLTDVMLQGRIAGVNGACRRGDRNNTLAVTSRFSAEFSRGPAMQGRDADVLVFVAVTEGERILDKQIYQIRVSFPPNLDRITVTSGDVDMLLPVSQEKSGAAYTIIAGFQLTPEELEANRMRAAGQ